jgi:hypothetical protein
VYVEVAHIVVGARVIGRIELESQLLGRLETECGQEVQVLRVEVRAGLFEETELIFSDANVLELYRVSVRNKL